MKSSVSSRSQKVILKNIAEKVNEQLSIFKCYDEEEYNDRAELVKDEVEVHTGKGITFSQAVMERVMKVINSYTNKYENLHWNIQTEPVMRFSSEREIYWLNAPKVVIYFYNN